MASHYSVASSAWESISQWVKADARRIRLERCCAFTSCSSGFALSDPAMEESLCDGQSMMQFSGLSLTRDGLPDETTILDFRHLLERNDLATRLRQRLTRCSGERDPDMHQTKKGN